MTTKIRITIEAEMSDDALLVYPNDEKGIGKENMWHNIRKRLLLLDLEKAADLCCRSDLPQEMIDALKLHNRVDIALSRQFDETLAVEYIETQEGN